MASLKNLLQRTMLFTAAADSGLDAYTALKVAPSDPVAFPAPAISGATPTADRAVWHWTHDPNAPATLSNVSAIMPAAGMAMSVATKIEVESVSVMHRATDDLVDLPLSPTFVLAKYALAAGKMAAHSSGWWRLAANLDCSILVVFGYELVVGSDPLPLDLTKIDALGANFFPAPDVPSDDPDGAPGGPTSTQPTGSVQVGQQIVARVAPPWVIVAVGFTTCKERADFEPGAVLGAGRIYPHVMVAANQPTFGAEAKIHVVRPATVMTHSSESLPDVGMIFIADTNDTQFIFSKLGIGSLRPPPLPTWSNFFDYYDLTPATGAEYQFVDPAKAGTRVVSNGIQREKAIRFSDPYESSSDFTKFARQGAFDNIHVAPRMKFSNPATGLTISNIVMAPFCEHDCLHTHTRWGLPTPDLPPWVWGFDGRKPYAAKGAPLVPGDQSVFITRTSTSSFRYRARAEGTPMGAWTVFYHHGSAYSLSIAAPSTFSQARFGVAAAVIQLNEPYTRALGIISPIFDREITDVNPTLSLAALYQRLQFTGTADPDVFLPRIKILDLDLCRRS